VPAAASAQTLAGRRARAPPSLFPRRLEAAVQDRRAVRNPLVSFVRALVHLVAGFIFAGAPPWFLLAVRHVGLSSPVLEDAAVFAKRSSTSRCKSRSKWCTLVPF
jgi:hypothetical protein